MRRRGSPSVQPAPKILVAYDGSPSARRALAHAAALVGRGARVTVVNVIPEQSVSARLQTVSDAERAQQHRLLREAEALLARQDVEATTVAAIGDPVAEILAAARECDAEIVVVGRERELRHRLVHSSVSSRLVRRAAFDVLVVP